MMDPAIATELFEVLTVMLDQIEDDPRAVQFFDLRLIARARAAIDKARNAG